MFAYSIIRRPTTQILQFSNEKHMWSFMIVFHKVLYSRYYVSHHCIFGSAFFILTVSGPSFSTLHEICARSNTPLQKTPTSTDFR